MAKPFVSPRTAARQKAMQALYQWQYTRQTIAFIEQQFLDEEVMKGVQIAYFKELLHEISAQAGELDEELAPLLDRPIQQLNPVEHAILWIGLYELIRCPDVPWRVIINEAVEIAKIFGAQNSHKYINGVLDKAARRCRAVEISSLEKR